MKIALAQALDALNANEFPVGCVMVCDGEVVASGRRNNSYGKINEMDHAEMITLRTLLDLDEHIAPELVTVYSTMEPCLMCFSTLLVNGVRDFVYSYEDAMGGGTNLPLAMLSPLYKDLDITITGGIFRDQSLGLFKKFFLSGDNDYLKNSLLAEYTLKQQ